MLEAVVLRTWLPSDPLHPGRVIQQIPQGDAVGGVVPTIPATRLDMGALNEILCDVLVYTPRFKGFQYLVRVMQPIHGRSDAAPWYPRPSRAAATGQGPLSTGLPGAATSPADLDGDHVILGFLGGDRQRPIILGALTHPRAAEAFAAWQVVTSGAGPIREHVIRHRGTKIRIDAAGNLWIDTTGATRGALDPTGTEFPDATTGKITITAGPTQKVIVAGALAVELLGAVAVARHGDSTGATIDAAHNTAWHAFFNAVAGALGGPLPGLLATAEAASLSGAVVASSTKVGAG